MRQRAALVALLLCATLGVPAAQANETIDPVPDPFDACPEDTNPSAPFPDRDDIAPVHVLNTDCAYNFGITEGFGDGTFRPTAPVTRDQFASFLVRTLEAAEVELPEPSDQGFRDIAGSHHVDAINILAETGIAAGRDAETFAPRDTLSREQNATFVMRAAAFIQGVPLSAIQRATGPFDDIGEASDAHVANINGAAHFNITTGRTATIFAPREDASRQQMASFLIRILVMLGDDELIPPEAIVDDLEYPNRLAVNPVGTDYGAEVVARAADGSPVSGAAVRFEVFRHDAPSLEADPVHGDADYQFEASLTSRTTTDTDGRASSTYTGPEDPARDWIAACVVRGSVVDAPLDEPVCGEVIATDDGQQIVPTDEVPAAAGQKLWGFPADAAQVTATGLQGSLLGADVVADPVASVSLPNAANQTVATDRSGTELGLVAGVLELGLVTTRAAGDLDHGLARGEATVADVSLDLAPEVEVPLVCDLLPNICDLADDLLDVEVVAADTIDVATTASCRGSFEDLQDASDSRFTGLTVAGEELPDEIPANTGIEIDGALGVVVNEVVSNDEAGDVGYRVTGLRVTALDVELLEELGLGDVDLRVAEAVTALDCAGEGAAFEAPGLDAAAVSRDEHINWIPLESVADELG